ncbi:response regulator [Candidatus Nitrospira nitrificans]|uniref:Oxygen sensor histidine kinase NreB n=1 Tax=Candidatus Nitrospira nitrificans TaxID=1742973 RepID=A0A0S4LPE8_9BACT|nr:response regulator [Candidatus Nitrospira nitrificans]CUS39135.1 putative Histidine kinase [Candidatus Nitrospira nitrificans]
MTKANILIVEDEAIVAADLADKLERAGYAISGTVSRGEHAVRMVRQNRPDLILMDIRLAGPLDGIEVAESLKSFTDVPVVFLTAHSDDETIRRAGFTDPFGYILKPFVERDLTTQIDIALYRYQAERALRDSEGKYRALVETAFDGIITLDEQGTILSCNAAAERMFGYPRKDLLRRNVAILMPDAFPAGPRSWLGHSATPETGGVSGGLEESTGRRCDGIIFPLEISLNRTSMGTPITYTVIIRDVTERHAIHQKVCRLAEQLEQRVEIRTAELVQSQARLRVLAAELSLIEQRERKRLATDLHDHLAQLLVLGRLQLGQAKALMIGHSAAALVDKTVDVLNESLQYTRTLIADLSPPVLQDFGLPSALEWLGDHMQQHKLTVGVRWSGSQELSLPGDISVLLFQSVRELLINAAKHAGSGKAVVSAEQRDGSLLIEVRDDGQGFDPKAIRGDMTPQSSKFGLFSIKERMIAMGGQFDLRSSPGEGTTATLILPINKPAPVSSAVDPAQPPPRESNEGAGASPLSPENDSRTALIRVLLADDHTVVRQGLRSLMESYADMVVVGEAGNGIEAVAMADALLPDVVIMDVNMPKMNGVDATGQIKTRHPSMVVIGLSMHDDIRYEQGMKTAGAAAYITKDSISDHLHNLIRANCPANRREIPGEDDVLSHAHPNGDIELFTQDRPF